MVVVIRLPIYGFLVVSDSNMWHNSAPLRDISFQNLSDLDFDISRSNVMVSLDSIYGFILIYIVTAYLSLIV